jgi:hypothetical protein
MFAGAGIPSSKKIDKPVELIDITLPLLFWLVRKMPKWKHPAITTWGENNHSIKTTDFRFIQYEDGSQELYNIRKDPNE